MDVQSHSSAMFKNTGEGGAAGAPGGPHLSICFAILFLFLLVGSQLSSQTAYGNARNSLSCSKQSYYKSKLSF